MQLAKINFSNDGIRAIVGQFPLTKEGSIVVGRAIGNYLLQFVDHPVVMVGRDTRPSSQTLLSGLSYGLASWEIPVYDLGIITTPALAYLVRKSSANFGIIITASHNPAEYNGLKFINQNGMRISHSVWLEIEKEIHRALKDKASQYYPELIKPTTTLIDCYIQDQVNQSQALALDNLKFVIDCANGSSARIVPDAFQKLGAQIVTLNDSSSSDQIINFKCGSEYVRREPQEFIQIVRKNNAHYGLSFDGDGDRLVVVDADGNFYNGDDFLFILAQYFRSQNTLHRSSVVTTRVANSGLISALEQSGICVTFTRSGDRYIEEELVENNYHLGAEQFGNVFVYDSDHIAADPLYAFLLMSRMLNQKTFIELVRDFQKTPQVKAVVKLRTFEKNKDIFRFLIDQENASMELLGNRARVFHWLSTTEPGLLNIIVEGNLLTGFEMVKNQAVHICSTLAGFLGVQANITLLDLSTRKRL
jgi:phosphoglucosamine mutase